MGGLNFAKWASNGIEQCQEQGDLYSYTLRGPKSLYRIQVNWAREADLAILEGTALDQLDISLPPSVRIAVMMAHSLRLQKESLSCLVERFYQVSLCDLVYLSPL